MTTCAIMQPTYLPWAGYFNLISSVDKFVFLDDVQFERRSWQSRNRIVLHGQEKLLSVSTSKAHRNANIKEILINHNTNWQKSHMTLLKSAYNNHPFSDELFLGLEHIYSAEWGSLVSLNSDIILHFCGLLELDAEFFFASSLNCSGERTDHLIQIAESIGCDQYLSPLGSKEYLTADGFKEKTDIELLFQNFNPKEYTQFKNSSFISHLSIVDVLANLGKEKTKEYIL